MNAGTSGNATQPQPLSNADQNSGGANNGGHCGAYCSTRDGSAAQNGNGNGAAVGKPCAGCVGKADNKNPPGQQPNGSDHNKGYECDANHGIGRTNPAHTGCITSSTPPAMCSSTNTCGGSAGDCTTTNTCGGSAGDCTTTGACPSTTPNCVPTASDSFCSTVLGVHHGRPTTTATTITTPRTTVLGEKFVRTPTPSVQPGVLPFTGMQLSGLLGLTVGLLLVGGAAVRLGRRRTVDA